MILPRLPRSLRRLTVVLALLVASAAGAWWFAQRGVAADVVRAEQQPLRQSLVFSARVASAARADLASTTTGRVERVLVREGDRVSAGQPLIELEAAEARAQVAQAQAALASAETRLRAQGQVSEPIALAALMQARSNVEFAERELARQRQLFAQGFVGQARVDDADRAVRVARASLTQAEAQAAGNAAGGAEAATAASRVREAQAALAYAQARLAQTRILAPADGRIVARQVEPGDVVQAARKLLTLAFDGETRLVAQIDERNLVQLRLGQQAIAAADAFPGQRFAAVVAYLAPAADPTRGTVEARLQVQAPPAFLRDEMTVSVEVVTAERSSAIVLPAAALRERADRNEVLVLEDGVARARVVRVGIRTPQRIEILEGLSAGEPVVIDPAIGPGQRVRARSARAGASTAAPDGAMPGRR